jgi:hypothetical protein
MEDLQIDQSTLPGLEVIIGQFVLSAKGYIGQFVPFFLTLGGTTGSDKH